TASAHHASTGKNGRSAAQSSTTHASSRPACRTTKKGKCPRPDSMPPRAKDHRACRVESTSSAKRSNAVAASTARNNTMPVLIVAAFRPASCRHPLTSCRRRGRSLAAQEHELRAHARTEGEQDGVPAGWWLVVVQRGRQDVQGRGRGEVARLGQ